MPVPQISAKTFIFRKLWCGNVLRSIGTTFPHLAENIMKKIWKMKDVRCGDSELLFYILRSSANIPILRNYAWNGKFVWILHKKWKSNAEFRIFAEYWDSFSAKASNPLRKIACGVPHDAEFRMMRNSAWCGVPHDAEFRMMQTSIWCGVPHHANFARNSSMPLLLIPVCSVFPDLYDKKIRIIMVYLWLATELFFFCLTWRQIFSSQGIFILRAVYMCNVNAEMFL